jgi:hypothetical protein
MADADDGNRTGINDLKQAERRAVTERLLRRAFRFMRFRRVDIHESDFIATVSDGVAINHAVGLHHLGASVKVAGVRAMGAHATLMMSAAAGSQAKRAILLMLLLLGGFVNGGLK